MKRLLRVLVLLAVSGVGAAQTIDGVVDSGEYPHTAELGAAEFRISWAVDGDLIHLAFSADTTGWVAIGFDPGAVMDQADMIFGWVEADGTPQVVDAFSTDLFGPHPRDTELGGTDDILAFSVTEQSGQTTTEVTRRLSTMDRFDKNLPVAGEVSFIWAVGATDDWNTIHSRSGYGTLEISSGEVDAIWMPPPVVVHAVLLSISFLMMLSAMCVPRYLKRVLRSWRSTHIAMEVSGAALGIVGAAVGFWMVQASSGGHLQVTHAWFALVTIILLIVTPIVGQMFLKLKKGKRELRLAHHWTGRFALAMMAGTILLGFIHAGSY